MLCRLALSLLFSTVVHLGFSQALPEIPEKTRSFEKRDGFFPIYVDKELGKVYLEIIDEQKEFLYTNALSSGLGSNDVGLDRNRLGDAYVAHFERAGLKVMMVVPNQDYRALSNDPFEVKAVAESFASGTIWGFDLVAKSGNRLLIDITDFLLRDALQIVATLRRAQQGSFSLDRSRSSVNIAHVKAFPQNSEFESALTFTSTDGSAGRFVSAVASVPNAVTLTVRNSFIELPEPGFVPRVFDPRSGFIPFSYFDFATPVSEPIQKYFVIRHRLEKRDKNLEISEPVEPIVYYLDRGTPEPIRTALMEGARWWTSAFNAAGYRNAFRVELLPEDADPLDVRYNMINWVHRSTRGWSYGASVVDPRTGEIIKGNVTLGSLRVRQDYLIFSALLGKVDEQKANEDEMLKASLWRLRQLAAHEVGHTLGLMHNYSSSVNGRASVMDYPHPLVELRGASTFSLENVYTNEIGEWDKVAINWGYREFANAAEEKRGLDQILDNARQRGLGFISDRDARAPGGMHPDAHLWDNGKNSVDELDRIMQVRQKAIQFFNDGQIKTGTPNAFLEDVFVPVYFFHRYQTEAVAKWVGGMNYTYSLKGDRQPGVSVLRSRDQLLALNALVRVLDVDNLVVPERIVTLIPPRPAGYAPTRELFSKRTGLAFDRYSPGESMADLVFGLLFNSERLNRLAQIKPVADFGLEDMTKRLVDAFFKNTRYSGNNAPLQYQTAQILLTYMLYHSVNPQNSFPTRAALTASLDDLKTWLETAAENSGGNLKGHYLLALERMKKPHKINITEQEPMPPGAPIGCDFEY